MGRLISHCWIGRRELLPANDRIVAAWLVGFSAKHCLMHIVTNSTREINTFDLIFTNNSEIIPDCEERNMKLSDHRMIVFGMLQLKAPAIPPTEGKNYLSKLNFFAANVN